MTTHERIVALLTIAGFVVMLSVFAYAEWRTRVRRARRAHEIRREGRRDVLAWQGVIDP